MSFPSLPLELVDYIVDYLHDNIPALLACVLACRQFRASSQFHLLECISLYEWTAVERNLEHLEVAPHVAALITTVRVEDNSPMRSWISGLSSVLTLLSKLSNVRYLAFRGRTYTHQFQRFACSEMFTLSSVQEVVIEELDLRNHGMIRDHSALAKFLSGFPRMRAVALGPTEAHAAPLPSAFFGSTPPPNFTLSSLRLSRNCIDFWTLEWLMPAALSLERLHVAYAVEVLDWASRLMLRTASSLRYLRCSQLYDVSEADSGALYFILNANKCRELRALRLDDLKPRRDLSQCPYLILQVMERLLVNALEHITLSLDVSIAPEVNPSFPEGSTWGRLDESLMSPRFPSLRIVEIRLTAFRHNIHILDWNSLAEAIKAMLPRLLSSGMLIIRYQPEGRHKHLVRFPIH